MGLIHCATGHPDRASAGLRQARTARLPPSRLSPALRLKAARSRTVALPWIRVMLDAVTSAQGNEELHGSMVPLPVGRSAEIKRCKYSKFKGPLVE
jgi:hypothetical protein